MTALVEPVRTRVLHLAAEVLPSVVPLPVPLRRVATFAPSRRARLGGNAIWEHLVNDDGFRAQVGVQVEAVVRPTPQAAAEPDQLTSAALMWLTRPEGWAQSLNELLAGLTSHRSEADQRELTRELSRLVERAETADRALRAAKDEHRERLAAEKAAYAELRRRLGESRAEARSLRSSVEEVTEQLTTAAAEAKRRTERDEAELRRLRARVGELEDQLRTQRTDRKVDREEITIRARLLLDTVIEAASGLRRELALPLVEGEPADRLEDQLARAQAPLGVAFAGGAADSSALLEQTLALPRARLLVDGYNVSRQAWPQATLEAGRSRLVRGLGSLVARTQADTTVVFDAAETAHRPTPPPAPRGVKVLFSPPGVIADDVIVQLVSAEPAGRPVVVISDDRDVASRAERLGARAVGSTALVGLLG